MVRTRLAPLLLAAASLPACYLSHETGAPEPEPHGCAGEPPVCLVARGCQTPEIVAASCGADEWSCPDESTVRVAEPFGDTCLPFRSAFDRVEGILLPIDDADGGCGWLFDAVEQHDGTRVERGSAGLPLLPVGACPDLPRGGWGLEVRPRVDLGGLAGDRLVQPLDVTRAGGRSWLSYQLFAVDAGAVFGVRGLGKGLVAMDAGTLQFRPVEELGWRADDGATTYGDSVVPFGDEVFVYGCKGPVDFLATECRLSRAPAASLGEASSFAYRAADGWTADREAAGIVTRSGVETSVRHHAALERILLTTAPGFGTEIEVRSAPEPQGPWSDVLLRVPCELPAGDEQAFCTAVTQHPELMDPLAPGVVVVSYAINSLAPDAAERRAHDPDAYWPRLARLSLPDLP